MRILKWLASAIAAIVFVVVATIVIAGALYASRTPERTAGGLVRTQSLYITMSDGVRIAVDVVLPKDLSAGSKVPVLIKGTPYWRGGSLSFIGGALAQLGLLPDISEPDTALLSEKGYALLLVDTRGTGASFGHVSILLDDREVADFGEIIDWAASQPWSNGRVGAYGFSYRGFLAMAMASLNRPALKAIAPTFEGADLYLLMRPGGVLNEGLVKRWSDFTAALNRGEAPWCGDPICRLVIAGPKRVDADGDGALLAAAIADHAKNWNVYECARQTLARDDKVCDSGKSLADVSELADRAAIERSGIPIYSTVGYFDANLAALTLARFRTFSNPQVLVMGALSHGGFMSTDPFAPGATTPDPTVEAQTDDMAKFFDRYLKHDETPGSDKTIRYLMLNGGGWKTADRWPPAGAATTTWYLGDDHMLSTERPTAAGVDDYAVDFGASTGATSRYRSPVDLSRTTYDDRVEQDKRLLTYTSESLAADVEIAGSPLATLTLGADTGDGAIIVYLERIAPNGAVTYLSEGVLRLTDRKLARDASAISGDAHHTYLAADASPWPTGQVEPVVIELLPIAVRIDKGDRLRVAIAGADAGNLERLPASGTAKFRVVRGAAEASRIEIPQMQVSATP